MDGFGLSTTRAGNAPLLAKTPTLDYLYANFPKTTISAAGLEVGLGPNEPGNSEVGHLNIGCGRVVWQNLSRINLLIMSGAFFQNETLIKLFEQTRESGRALHLIGLASEGGVHSHLSHLLALLEFAKKEEIKKVYIHFIADGRDTGPQAAKNAVEKIEALTKKLGCGKIATLVGRFYAMDRDKNLDRTDTAFRLMTEMEGIKYPSTKAALDANYQRKLSDEFLEPAVIEPGGKIEPGDSIIFFNHRNDRIKQIFNRFARNKDFATSPIVSMTKYDRSQQRPYCLEPINLKNTLSDVISQNNLTQLHTAETEKYAHVTYFFKGGRTRELPDEKDIVVPSPKNIPFEQVPAMSAPKIAEAIIHGIHRKTDFIVANFANPDMVGHTGHLNAAIQACEAVDGCLSQILTVASAENYKVFLTADHGNCETMIDEKTLQPSTEHTTNHVPFLFLDFSEKKFEPKPVEFSIDNYLDLAASSATGILADIAPSILANLGIEKPAEFTGTDLTLTMKN